MKTTRSVLALGLSAALFAAALAPGTSLAGKKDKKKNEHLEYRSSYGRALAEARIRNVPVFVSRHKDF